MVDTFVPLCSSLVIRPSACLTPLKYTFEFEDCGSARLLNMAEYGRTSTSTDDSSTLQKAPNFSRPQPKPSALKSGNKDSEDRRVHIIDAFHDPNRYPNEPRFSEDSSATDNTTSQNSASSDFAWDGHSGELDSKARKKRFDAQRCAAKDPTLRPSTSITSKRSNAPSDQTFNLGLPSSNEPSTKNGILKRVSVDQRSERIPPPDQWEDSASHHTVSEDGDSIGSFDSEGRWQSSDYDTSSLSAAEIRKLEKKGINPALYMEMKQAKKGKKWAPHLLGNGFIN